MGVRESVKDMQPEKRQLEQKESQFSVAEGVEGAGDLAMVGAVVMADQSRRTTADIVGEVVGGVGEVTVEGAGRMITDGVGNLAAGSVCEVAAEGLGEVAAEVAGSSAIESVVGTVAEGVVNVIGSLLEGL
jgi:hypothetical protein